MKKIAIICTLLLVLGFTMHEDQSAGYDYYPVLMDVEDLRGSIAFQSPRNLERPAKFYIKGDYLFVSEKYEGIHVFNNQNPSDPVNVGFIRIPGCLDMAVKASVLYADNAIDLVAIDLSDPEQPALARRLKDVFPEITPPGGHIPYQFRKEQRPEGTVIIEWKNR